MPSVRHWPSSLQPSSYGSARFYVDSNEVETGRDLDVHEFPHRDDPYVEDMRRKTNIIPVTAYVASDQADKEAAALAGACERGGAQTLRLPMESFRAHCESCKRVFNKDQLGYIAFSLRFVRDGSGAAPFALPVSVRQVEWLASQIAAPLAARFAATFKTLGASQAVSEAAVDVVRHFAAYADVSLATVRMTHDLVPQVHRSVQDIDRDAAELVRQGAIGNNLTETSGIDVSVSESSALPDRIVQVMQDVRAAAVDEAESVRLLAMLVTYEAPLDEAPIITPSGTQRGENAEAIASTIRLAALAEYAAAVIARPYEDRRAAIAARAELAVTFEAAMAPLTGAADGELLAALMDIRGETIHALSQVILSLASVIFVQTPKRLPAVVLSQRLYGTADRAEEIVARNRVEHPGFVPTDFEALAS